MFTLTKSEDFKQDRYRTILAEIWRIDRWNSDINHISHATQQPDNV